MARRAAVVHRHGRHVRDVVVGLQLAPGRVRAPARAAARSCPIYATDDRYTDDVHYMGGVLQAVDLVDYVLYMAAMNALPPVPAVYGDGWREEWLRRIEGTEPWLLRWLEEQDDGPYWRHGSLRPGLRAHHLPDDDRRRLGRRLPQQHASARSPRCAARSALLIGPWSHMSTATVAARAAHRPRARDHPLVRPLAARRRERDRRRAADRRVRAALDAGPRPTSRRCAASGAPSRRGRPTGSRRAALAPGRRRRRRDPRPRRRRQARPGSPAPGSSVGATGGPARGRRAVADLRLARSRGSSRSWATRASG